MSNQDLELLLQPTLSSSSATRPIYSVRASFFTAFFGGVYAIVILSWLNSHRLRRLPSDIWIYLVIAIGWSLMLVWFGSTIASGEAPQWLLAFGNAQRTARYAGRFLALVVFCVVYLLHRRFHQAQATVGSDPPNPWPVGIGAAAASIVLTFVFVGIGVGLLA
jgi:hypothetical protein